MLRAAGFQNEHAYAAYRGSERKLCLLGFAAAELGVTSSARPRQLFRTVRLRDAKIAAKRSVWGVFCAADELDLAYRHTSIELPGRGAAE